MMLNFKSYRMWSEMKGDFITNLRVLGQLENAT